MPGPVQPTLATLAFIRRIYLVAITAQQHLIAVAHTIAGQGDFWTFPTTVKPHPRSNPDVVAGRLIRDELHAAHMDLRLVALVPPTRSRGRAAVYTARLAWVDDPPTHTARGRHRLHALDTDALQGLDLRPRDIAALFTDAAVNLSEAVLRLPDIRQSATLPPAGFARADANSNTRRWADLLNPEADFTRNTRP